MLTIAEEVLLLVIDEESGKFRARLPAHSLRNAVSGALLMELALHNRIDTDLHQLMVIDPVPLGEPLLDRALARIVADGVPRPTAHWVGIFAEEYDTLQPQLLSRLVQGGILERREGRLLRGFGSRRYPVLEGGPLRAVKRRMMEVLTSDVIPAPRDVVIICLADACALWRGLFHSRELPAMQPRIAQVVRLDLIGQAVTRTIRELQDATRGLEAKWFK